MAAEQSHRGAHVRHAANSSLCARSRRFGGASDNGWTLCTDARALHTPAGPCVVFSFGIGFDAGFDLDLARRMPWCELFMFDPTPAIVDVLSGDTAAWTALHGDMLKRNKAVDSIAELRAQTRGLFANGTATPSPGALSLPNVRFFPLGLAAQDQEAGMRNWWTIQARTAPRNVSLLSLESVVARVGRRPSVIKLDIEGAEKEPGLLQAVLQSGAVQLLLELHNARDTPPPKGLPRLPAADLLATAAAANYLPWREEKAQFSNVHSIHCLVKKHGAANGPRALNGCEAGKACEDARSRRV